MHVIAPQHTDRALAKAVIGNNAEKSAIYAKIRERKGHVRLASAVTGFKIGRHTDRLIVRRRKPQHDLSDRKESLRTDIVFKNRIHMLHSSSPFTGS